MDAIKRRDLRAWYNRTKSVWVLEVLAPMDKEVVEDKYEIAEIEFSSTVWTEIDTARNVPILRSFGCVSVAKMPNGLQKAVIHHV